MTYEDLVARVGEARYRAAVTAARDETVEEAWRETTREPAPETRIRRVLRLSGPVPWTLKAPFFAALGPRGTPRSAAIDAAQPSTSA